MVVKEGKGPLTSDHGEQRRAFAREGGSCSLPPLRRDRSEGGGDGERAPVTPLSPMSLATADRSKRGAVRDVAVLDEEEGNMPLTSIPTRGMYGVATQTPSPEGQQRSDAHADRRQEPISGDAPCGAVQEGGPHVRRGGNRGWSPVPPRRRDRTQEPVVRGEGRDGRSVQRLPV